MKRLLILMPLAALAGCNTDQVQRCPSASILSDTANLTVFRAGAPHDPSGEAYTAMIDSVRSSCQYTKGDPSGVASFTFSVRATRAPTSEGVTYTLPYYLALSQGERLLSKKNMTLKLTFAPGSATATDSETLPDTTVDLEPGHPLTDYQLLVGFQLSDEERAYNQKRGRFSP